MRVPFCTRSCAAVTFFFFGPTFAASSCATFCFCTHSQQMKLTILSESGSESPAVRTYHGPDFLHDCGRV
jgi:hypothetical protein